MLQSNIIDAGAAIAEALCLDNPQTMLSLTAPESNTVGAAMLAHANNLSLEGMVERAVELDVLVILENDLTRRLDAVSMQKLVDSGTKIIALDVIENATVEHANMVLPAASFAESQGTLINHEGRAQRFFPVFPPAEQRLPSWQWLLQLAALSGNSQLAALTQFDEVVDACAASQPAFAHLNEVAPDRRFRDRGQKIPRQTHRYSGRTAINAGVSVHEPQQPVDHETPLAFSMEGLNRDQPSTLIPFVWSPGWNSNHALQKFQAEVDGPLKGGHSGVHVLVSSANGIDHPGAAVGNAPTDLWQLVPVHRLHGSEELSARSDEIAELAGDAFIALNAETAGQLEVAEGDRLKVIANGDSVSLAVKIVDRMAVGCAGYSYGYAATRGLIAGAGADLQRDTDWRPPQPSLIATDRQSMAVDRGSPHV